VRLNATPLAFLLDLTVCYGDLVRYKTAYGATYLVNHPEHIGHVLNNANYRRGSLLTMVLGHGLLASEGDYRRRQRRQSAQESPPGRVPRFTRTSESTSARSVASSKNRPLLNWHSMSSRSNGPGRSRGGNPTMPTQPSGRKIRRSFASSFSASRKCRNLSGDGRID
jgi:hypothetical protein